MTHITITPHTPLSLVEQIMEVRLPNGLPLVIDFQDFQSGGGFEYLIASPGRKPRSVVVRWNERTYSIRFSPRASSRMVRGESDLLPEIFKELNSTGLGDEMALKLPQGGYLRLSRVSHDWDRKPVSRLQDLPAIRQAHPLQRAVLLLRDQLQESRTLQLKSMSFVHFWIQSMLISLQKSQTSSFILKRKGRVELLTYILVPIRLWQGDWPQRTIHWQQLGNFDLWPNYFGIEDAETGVMAVIIRDTDDAIKALYADFARLRARPAPSVVQPIASAPEEDRPKVGLPSKRSRETRRKAGKKAGARKVASPVDESNRQPDEESPGMMQLLKALQKHSKR